VFALDSKKFLEYFTDRGSSGLSADCPLASNRSFSVWMETKNLVEQHVLEPLGISVAKTGNRQAWIKFWDEILPETLTLQVQLLRKLFDLNHHQEPKPEEPQEF